MPDFKALTQDPRYTGLPWSQKQEVIRRFSEDNPSPHAPIAEEFERLKHYSADGTPQSKQFHSNLFAARESQYKAMLKGDDPTVAAKKYSEAANVAKSIYADSVTRRQEDLGLAMELADMNSRTGVSFGNTLAAVFDSPRMFADSVVGELTPRQKGIEQAEARRKEIVTELTGRGYDEDAVSLLLQDAALATGATNGAPAAVDSQGHVVVNDGALVMDIEKVRTAIRELDAPDFSKEETLNRLELRQRAVIEQVFDSAEKGNGVTYDVDDRGVKSNPKISPVTSLGSVVSAVGSSFASLATGKPSQLQKRFFSSLQIGGGSQFDFDQKAEAVKQFVTERDDALDRARIGLETGLLVDTANMVLTPFELAGSDVAGDAASFLAATGASTSPADRLANISKTAEFTELALRVIGQAAITRKVGTGTLAATGSSKLAAAFAIGYGSELSATFNAREVLDSGGSDSEALVAGILGFGTTFALASGFNAIGAGGLEQFRSKASAAANAAKLELVKKLAAAQGGSIVIKGSGRAVNVARGGIGEGVEEFVDEFINGLITQKYTGASADQLAENALKAALIGSGIGATVSAFGPVAPDVTISDINLDTPDSAVKAAADKAMADLSQAPVGTTTVDVEATDTTDQFAAAARVTELREKADTDDGLTDPEIEELQRLEDQLDPNTPSVVAPAPAVEEEAPAAAVTEPSQDTTPVADEVPAKDPFVEEESVEEAPDPVFQVDDAGDVSPVEETAEEVTPPDPITEQDNVDELRDSLFDTLNAMSDSDLTVEQQAEFDSRINDATTPAEMSAIEQELLDIYTEKNAPKPKSKAKAKSNKVASPDTSVEFDDTVDVTPSQKFTPEESLLIELSGLPYRDMKRRAERINEAIRLNRTNGNYPGLASVQPIKLNAGTVKMMNFIVDSEKFLAESTTKGSETAPVEEDAQVEDTGEPYVDPVNEFLARATPYQKQEYIRRALEGEDMVDILETLDTPDAAELLTEEEILAGVTPEDSDSRSEDEGDTEAGREPVILYSMIGIPDPQLVINTAKSLYKGVKTLTVFAKRMITAFGNRIRPIVRNLFHDLRRNRGEIKEAIAAKPTDPAEVDSDQAALDAALDAQLESESPTPSEGLPADRIDVPKGTTRADMDKMADQLTGSQNLLIPFIGKGLQYLSLGITKQVRSQITGEFFQRPYLSWLFERELANRRSAFIANQFVLRYGNELGANKDGTLKNVTARDPESSLHPSDVIEAVMNPDRRNEYVVSDDFLKMVADWTSVRNQILKHASDAGIDLKFLKDEDGNFDNTKILENFYFPRGTVMLTESPEDSAGGVGSSRPKSKVKSFSFGRTFESEKVAVESGKYQYPDTPAQRIQNFATDVYSRIADRNFATHPDMIRASEKPRFAKNEDGKNVKLKPLGKSVINLAGTSLTFNNSKINILNSLIDGGRLNPDDAFSKAAKVAQFVRSIKFTFDASVAAVQLVYLWGTNPVRHGRAMGIALATTFGNKSWLENYTRERRSIISEYVSVGGLYDKTFEDADFLRTTDATHTQARKVLAKLFSPFTTLHATAVNVGAVEMYSILRYQAVNPETGQVDPVKAEKLARFADRTVGRESLTRNGVRASTRSFLSMISSAPSMYAAFINLMADTVSKDKFTRNNALKGHARFLATMSVMYVAQAFASMMVDDEDERDPEDKIMDALSRLNPASKKFMVIEAPIGEGRRVVFSQGGFFKAAIQTSARVTTDPRNAASYVAQFLKSRKSPGVGTALEIATGEDYFGNEITTLESLTDAMLPISLATVASNYKGPALDVVGGWLGMKGQSTTSLLEEKPHLSQTLEQMIFSVMGFSSYTESSRAEFNRKIDRLSDKEFGADYKDLDFKQKAAVIEKAEDSGIVKPTLKTATSYSQFVIEKMDKELRDTTLRRELVTREAYQEFAAVPRYSVRVNRKVSVPIESSDHKRMYSAYVKSMVEFAKTPEMKDLTKKQVLKKAELEWENQLRANGY